MRYNLPKFGCEQSLMQSMNKVLFAPISNSFRGMFLKRQFQENPHVPYKQCNFHLDRSTMKGTLFWGEKNVCLYLGFHLRDFPETSSQQCTRTLIKHRIFGCEQSIIEVPYMDSKEHLGLSQMNFLEVPYLAFPTHAVMKWNAFYSSVYYEGTSHGNGLLFRL